MACSREAPCGNVLRRVLTLDGLTVYQCLNAHSHVVGTSLTSTREPRHAADGARRPPGRVRSRKR